MKSSDFQRIALDVRKITGGFARCSLSASLSSDETGAIWDKEIYGDPEDHSRMNINRNLPRQNSRKLGRTLNGNDT